MPHIKIQSRPIIQKNLKKKKYLKCSATRLKTGIAILLDFLRYHSINLRLKKRNLIHKMRLRPFKETLIEGKDR